MGGEGADGPARVLRKLARTKTDEGAVTCTHATPAAARAAVRTAAAPEVRSGPSMMTGLM